MKMTFWFMGHEIVDFQFVKDQPKKEEKNEDSIKFGFGAVGQSETESPKEIS